MDMHRVLAQQREEGRDSTLWRENSSIFFTFELDMILNYVSQADAHERYLQPWTRLRSSRQRACSVADRRQHTQRQQPSSKTM